MPVNQGMRKYRHFDSGKYGADADKCFVQNFILDLTSFYQVRLDSLWSDSIWKPTPQQRFPSVELHLAALIQGSFLGYWQPAAYPEYLLLSLDPLEDMIFHSHEQDL